MAAIRPLLELIVVKRVTVATIAKKLEGKKERARLQNQQKIAKNKHTNCWHKQKGTRKAQEFRASSKWISILKFVSVKPAS